MTRPLAVALLASLAVAATARAALLDELAARQDEADEVVRAVAAAALAPGDGALSGSAATDTGFPSLDAPLHVLAAVRSAVPDRLDRVKDLLDDWDDPRAERLRAHFESTDAAEVAANLLRDERHDRWAAAVNDTIRPFGLGTNLLAVVNPVLLAGSAIDSVLTAVSHVRHRDRTTAREHEALAAYGSALEGTPDGRLGREDALAAVRLDERVRRTSCKALASRTEDAYEQERLSAAAYLLRSPAASGCGKELEDVRGDVQTAISARRAQRDAARWPATEPRLPRSAAEWKGYAAVARATVTTNPASMVLAAHRFASSWPDGPNVPATRLILAAARARSGHSDAARDELETIVDDGGPGAAAARDRLAALPDAEAEAVEAAERRHGRDVAQYVLLGTGPSTRGALRTAVQTGAQGVAGLPALGITNAVGVLTRGFLAWRRDPASNEKVITEGEAYLARHPNGRRAIDVRRRLVRAYERSERWDRALLHYQTLPDPDPEKIDELQGEIADDMLERAAADPKDGSLLQAVVTLYPASKAAERARQVIAARDTGAGIPIPRDVLVEVPWLLGSTGLGLPAGLLDGDESNGELDDAGIRITPYAIECTLRGDDDAPATETVAIAEADTARVFGTLAEIARIHRLNHPEGGDDERGRWEKWVPFFVQGGVGDTGVAVRPGIKLRPYEPAHPERYR